MGHGADRQEQREGDDDEVERHREEMPISQYGALLLRFGQRAGRHLRRKRNEIVREIQTAGHRADHRHDDVADQRTHNGAERRANDHADGEIDDIAAQREFFEFLEHPTPFSFRRRQVATSSGSAVYYAGVRNLYEFQHGFFAYHYDRRHF